MRGRESLAGVRLAACEAGPQPPYAACWTPEGQVVRESHANQGSGAALKTAGGTQDSKPLAR